MRLTPEAQQRAVIAVFIVALAAHGVMFFSLFFGYLDPLFHDTRTGDIQGVDFFAVYRAGELLLKGQSMYGHEFELLGSAPYASPYRYLPFTGETIGVALSLLKPWTAYWLWVSLIEVMLVANAWLTYRIVRDEMWSWLCAAMWFAYTPVYLEMWIGQFSFVMATLSLWTAALLIRSRETAAGAPWIVSVLTKSNSGLLLPMFLRLRQWRVIVALIVALVVINLPYFLAFPDDARAFWHENFGQYIDPVPIPPFSRLSGDYGFMAFVKALWFVHDPDAGGLPTGVAPLIAITVVGVSLTATFAPRTMDVVATFAAWWCAYFLIYLAWEHSYVMMLPALVLLTGLRPQYRVVTIAAFVVLALPAPFFILDSIYGHGELGFTLSLEREWPPWASAVNHAWKPMPVLMLWAVV
jgi:alpha-1,2-mannosyltransferase